MAKHQWHCGSMVDTAWRKGSSGEWSASHGWLGLMRKRRKGPEEHGSGYKEMRRERWLWLLIP